MTPAIKTGDVIITTPIKYKTPKIGDVIAYQAKRFNGAPVGVFSHRIIGGDINKGFIVKGDSNKSPDSQRPKANEILGSQLNTIHNLSYYLQLMAEVREALSKDRFSAYREEFHANRQRGVEPGQD